MFIKLEGVVMSQVPFNYIQRECYFISLFKGNLLTFDLSNTTLVDFTLRVELIFRMLYCVKSISLFTM
jgi:hypothetical protein